MLTITGLDELGKKLDDLAKKAKSLDGTHSVSMSELLTPEFISQHTRFADVNELFTAGGFKFENQAEFDAIPSDALDTYVRSESSFQDWQAMMTAAAESWAAKKLAG